MIIDKKARISEEKNRKSIITSDLVSLHVHHLSDENVIYTIKVQNYMRITGKVITIKNFIAVFRESRFKQFTIS